jgi:hypothetical protein
MNIKAPYELTITEKLEQLSVPDAVDAIWARIEATLDLEMPTDEGPGDPPPGSPAGPGFWVGTIFLAALVAVIYFVNNRRTPSEDESKLLRETPALIQSPGNNREQPPPPQSVGRSSRANTPRIADSVTSTPVEANPPAEPGIDVLLPAVDSQSATPTIPAPVINKNIQDTVPKKSRGVKGIKDADYRIEPAKKEGGD